MALTRKSLKAMGLTEEQVDSIIELHLEVKNDLEEQIKKYKADAEKLPDVQKELDGLKKGDGEDWKGKYEAEKSAHDNTKSEYAAKETAAKVKEAYRAMLKEAGVAEKYLATVLKATDLSAVKIDKDGKLEDKDILHIDIRIRRERARLCAAMRIDVEESSSRCKAAAGTLFIAREGHEQHILVLHAQARQLCVKVCVFLILRSKMPSVSCFTGASSQQA